MSVSVVMPQLGESVPEGTVTRWLKKEGEHVTADEPLLEVSTDKVDTEIPSPATGVLRGIVVDEDETVAVGAELAVIEEAGAEAGGGGGPPPAAAGPLAAAPAPRETAAPPAPPKAPQALEPKPEPEPEPELEPAVAQAPAAAPVNGASQAATQAWTVPAYEPAPAAPAAQA